MATLRTIEVRVTQGVPLPLEVVLAQGVPAGTLLRFRASGVTMLRGMRIASVTAMAEDVVLDIVHRFSWEEMQQDWMWHIQTLSLATARVPADLPAGARLAITCDPGAGAPVADLTWRLLVGRVASVEDLEFAPLAAPLDLHFVAGPCDHLEATLKPDGQVVAVAFDVHGNPAPLDPQTSLTLTLGEAEVHAQAGKGYAVRFDRLDPPVPGVRGYVVDTAGREAVTNAAPVALDGSPVYFGEFHWHTDFSGDGQRTLQAALTSARDELGLDFAGPADHIGPDGTYMQRLALEQAEICRRFDAPGRFCTIASAELSGRYGHANLVAADFETFLAIVHRFPHELLPVWRTMPDSYPLEVLAALCPEGRAMIVPHHTNMDSSVDAGVVRDDGRPFWCALHWPLPTPLLRQGLRLIELVQNRGAFESEVPDPLWHGRWGGFGGSARTALTRGHRIGFIGGTDNHTGWPTRLADSPGYGGLTAVIAPELTGPALFAGLYARRCYATSGARIVADATLNGAPLGSELRLSPGAPREFRIRVHGTAPLAAVQIISLGAVLADLPVAPDTLDFDATWRDERPGRPVENVDYYVRARQTDGHCVWLSPWWIDLA